LVPVYQFAPGTLIPCQTLPDEIRV